MKEDDENQVLDTAVSLGKMKQKANPELGMTQEYNRENRAKLWDSAKGKADYKEKTFAGKQTYVDPVTGKTLHKNKKAAQQKYHMKDKDGNKISSKWAEHAAETDHIYALKDGHDIAKHNPFLSDADFKEIMNSDENYRVLSKSANASKGEKSDWKVIFDKNSNLPAEGKIQMAKEKATADIALQAKFAVRTAQNAGKEFAAGAKDTLINSAVPLTMEAVNKMIKVAQGEESFGEAVKDMGEITADVAIAGGTNKLLVNTVAAQMKNSGSAVLKKIAGSNQVAQIIAVTAIIQKSLVKYINSEIDGKEFVQDVGEKGAILLVGMVAGAPGGILGAVIATMACSAVASLFDTAKHLNDYKLKESQIRRLESQALAEMENQRVRFREIVEREYGVWDERFQSGLDQMLHCACEETYDLQGVTEGLDRILLLCGAEAKFKTIDEYENQLNQPLKLSF